VLAVELNAAAENPGRDAASGNFHAGALALALDGLHAAHAQAARLVAERTSALLEPHFTRLPVGLAADEDGSSGALILEYAAHAPAGELSVLASPVTAQHG
jgi:histidine ammonia-lyase